MSAPLVTSLAERWRTRLTDACRSVAWSPHGRLLLVGADGRAVVDEPHHVTSPMSPDPVDATWISERQVGVVDAVGGVMFAGGGDAHIRQIVGAHRVRSGCGRVVVAGRNTLTVFNGDDLATDPLVVTTGVGQSHALTHTAGALWAVGGSSGLALVDAALGCTDSRIELDGVRVAVYAPGAERLVVSDLAASIHVIDLACPEDGIEIDGYPDPVRLLDVSSCGDLVVATADDELTWWWLSEDGEPGETPDRGVGHDDTITAMAMSADMFVATGDAAGQVRLWSPQLTDYPVTSTCCDSEIVSLAWSADGRRLAVAAMSGDARVLDIARGTVA